ncbi:MAG: DUF6473 family protein [Pseudomonadota bacterium]
MKCAADDEKAALKDTSSDRQEHLSGYQVRDYEVVDYKMYQEPRSALWFRGPPPRFNAPDYITFLGAAQTFGCFCDSPYPEILSNKLGVESVNLGYGGAGPRFYLRHRELIDIANAGRLAVVQVMSGRSEDNSRFRSGGLEYLTDLRTGEALSANAAYRRILSENEAPVTSPLLGKAIRAFHAPPAVKNILAETRRNWIKNNLELLEALTVPTILVWVSRRAPWYIRTKTIPSFWQRYDSLYTLFGEFPQLVNQSMINAVSPHADRYIQVVTRRGSPQPLISRFTGEPITINTADDREDLAAVWTRNDYYPSPEMHEDFAEHLLEPCKALLDQK